MNKEAPHRDQAEKLRRKIEKITEDSVEGTQSSGLPPRSKVHQHKKKKTKLKLKYPIIRLLVLFFVLLPIVSFSLYTINENKQLNQSEPATTENENYELVDVENEEEELEEKEPINPEPTKVEPEVEPEKPTIADGEPSTRYEADKKAEEGIQPIEVNEGKDKEEKVIYHKVQPEETLFSISMDYFRSQNGIDRIRQANGIQGNEIKVGQTLKIPLK